jgi:outer membrane protein OmpA-like peptidoglycan-associated protein/tetratricopeptide (TPR) repeat protein
MKVLVIFFSVMLTCIQVSEGQNIKILKHTGERCYRKGQYKNAFPYFEQILKTDPDNLNALYKAGVCNLYRYSKEQALVNFEKVYRIDSTYDKYLPYWLGRAYHLNGMFDEAFRYYSIFQEKQSKKSVQYQEVDKYKRQVNYARDYMANPSNYKVQNAGASINSSFSEHSPITSITDTFLLFTSRRTNLTNTKEEYDGEPFEDIFYSSRDKNGVWSKPESFQLNTSGHDASIQLFDNDTKLFIYSYPHDGDIFLVEKQSGIWGIPASMKAINTVDFESDAFMTADGKTLYFATNHFKKNGDLDICYVTKTGEGIWSKPESLSSAINTDEDEDAPYITADGKTMYFSSRGHTSMGGYDIFKSMLDTVTGKWMKPENLGYPVNTPDEDLYFCLSFKTRRAFMSSYRDGGFGEKDIYEVMPIEQVIVNGFLVDESNKSIDGEGLSVLLIPIMATSKTAVKKQAAVSGAGTFTTSCLSDNAYYVFVTCGIDTLYRDVLTLDLVEEKNQTITHTFIMPYKKISSDTNAVIVKQDTLLPIVAPAHLENMIYFASNFSELGPASKAELRNIIAHLEKYPAANIVLKGHADGSGVEALNYKLSEKRAMAARQYLELKGIAASRIKVEFFGSQQPIASNATEAGRAKNRRVEIIVE